MEVERADATKVTILAFQRGPGDVVALLDFFRGGR
jgi:hypothetical protein